MPDNPTSTINTPLGDFSVIHETVARQAPSDKIAEMENEKLFNDGKRGEAVRKHVHLVAVAFIYVVGVVFLSLVLVRAFHFASPPSWHWMKPEALHDIERILFSGAVITLAGKYFVKYDLIKPDQKS